jgi:hypothetical protein
MFRAGTGRCFGEASFVKATAVFRKGDAVSEVSCGRVVYELDAQYGNNALLLNTHVIIPY